MKILSVDQRKVYESLIRLGDSKALALKTVLNKEFAHQQKCHKSQLDHLTK